MRPFHPAPVRISLKTRNTPTIFILSRFPLALLDSFWAPTFKWMISIRSVRVLQHLFHCLPCYSRHKYNKRILLSRCERRKDATTFLLLLSLTRRPLSTSYQTHSNVSDFQRPVEQISYPQQLAVTATGLIWSRYSMVINPVNYNLFAVNVFMAITGIYQLYRKSTEGGQVPGAGFAAAGAK